MPDCLPPPASAFFRCLQRFSLRSIPMLFLVIAAVCYGQTRQPAPQTPSRGGELLNLPAVQSSFTGSHALLIGASNYHQWDSLPGVFPDLAAVHDQLAALGFEVEVLKDPTSEQLTTKMKALIARWGAEEQSRLIIYYAGHGHSMRQEFQDEVGYLVPVDAPLPTADSSGFRAKAISMHQLRAWAYEMQARHVLFILDACFAGTVFESFRQAPPYIAGIFTKPVREFITSGGARETARDRSIFRRFLVKGLNGWADLDGDRFITGTELGLYLKKQVSNETQGGQNPQFGLLPEQRFREGDFIFWSPAPEPVLQKEQAYLVLNSRPESAIRVDGYRLNAFPVLRQVVKEGEHDIRFEREGMAPHTR